MSSRPTFVMARSWSAGAGVSRSGEQLRRDNSPRRRCRSSKAEQHPGLTKAEPIKVAAELSPGAQAEAIMLVYGGFFRS